MKLFACVFVLCVSFGVSLGLIKCEIKLKVTGYEPRGISVKFPTIDDLEEFYFWGNINDEIDNRNNADIRISTFESKDGEWLAEDQITALKKQDKINYILYYKVDGELIKCEAASLTVDDIKTSTYVPEVVEPKPVVPKTPSPVDNCPHINIKSKDVVVDFYGHSDIERANLDKLAFLKISDCNVDYKLATGTDPSLLEIKIV